MKKLSLALILILLMAAQLALANDINWNGMDFQPVNPLGNRVWEKTADDKLIYLPTSQDDLNTSLLLTGNPADKNYHVSFGLRPMAPKFTIKLYLRYQDAQNYYVLTLNEINATFVKMLKGTVVQLACVPYTYQVSQWHQIIMDVKGDTFTLNINEDDPKKSLFSVKDKDISAGQIGVSAYSTGPIYFDKMETGAGTDSDNSQSSSTTEAPLAPKTRYAVAVVDYNILGTNNKHNDPSATLGPPDAWSGVENFVSLGGGYLVLDMGEEFNCVAGMGLKVYEVSSQYADTPGEDYEVQLSLFPNGPWKSVGDGQGTTIFDPYAYGIRKARYIKILDKSPSDNSEAPGADIDAVETFY